MVDLVNFYKNHLGEFHYYLSYIPLVLLIIPSAKKSFGITLVTLTFLTGIILAFKHNIWDLSVILHVLFGSLASLMILGMFPHYLKVILVSASIISGVWTHYGSFFFFGSSLLNDDPQLTNIIKDEQWHIFKNRVEPILRSKCMRCHNSENLEGNIRLDSIESLFHVDLVKPIILPFDSYKSQLYLTIAHEIEHAQHMPKFKGKINANEIKLIKDWIDNGALNFKSKDFLFSFKKKKIYKNSIKKWSFSKENRFENEKNIDDVYFKILEENSIKFKLVPIPREKLTRKTSLTVTGLLPMAFKDHSIDYLLNTKEYAERMLLKWLDITSYSDYDEDEVKAYAKRELDYKKFIIESFKNDQNYLRLFEKVFATKKMMREASFESAYRYLGFQDNSDSDYLLQSAEESFKTVFLLSSGINVSCARCHDHKHLDITNEDYYSQLLSFSDLYIEKDLIKPIIEEKSERELKTAPLMRKNLKVFNIHPGEDKDVIEHLTDHYEGTGFYTARNYVDFIFKTITGRSFISDNGQHQLASVNEKLIPLLNWLTYKFLEQNGSTKFLFQTITASKLFTHEFIWNEDKSFSLQDKRIMDYEVLRDNLLLLTKKLKRTSLEPSEAKPDFLTHKIDSSAKYSRSIYLPRNSADQSSIAKGFNIPNGDTSVFDRSIKSNYSLAMGVMDRSNINNILEALKNSYWKESAPVKAMIHSFYHDALNRSPNEREMILWNKYFAENNKNLKKSTMFFHIILNTNEFLKL